MQHPHKNDFFNIKTAPSVSFDILHEMLQIIVIHEI